MKYSPEAAVQREDGYILWWHVILKKLLKAHGSVSEFYRKRSIDNSHVDTQEAKNKLQVNNEEAYHGQ